MFIIFIRYSKLFLYLCTLNLKISSYIFVDCINSTLLLSYLNLYNLISISSYFKENRCRCIEYNKKKLYICRNKLHENICEKLFCFQLLFNY